MAQKEAKARLKINMLLESAGWRLLDDENGPANVDVENKVEIENAGDDFENIRKGSIDYLLLDSNQKPIAVLEAKRESIPPLSAKEQARDYANSIHVRYVILSNGNTHYLWDMQFGNPEPISSFPTLSSLEDEKKWVPDVDALANEEISKTYIAESQIPEIKSHPDHHFGNKKMAFRPIFIPETGALDAMRSYAGFAQCPVSARKRQRIVYASRLTNSMKSFLPSYFSKSLAIFPGRYIWYLFSAISIKSGFITIGDISLSKSHL